MASVEQGFDHLDAGGRLAAEVSRAPRLAVYATIAIAVVVSWGMLLALAVRAGPGEVGPGGSLLSALPALPLPSFLEDMLRLCVTPVGLDTTPFSAFAALLAMWFLMSVAMMLPTAAPMIRTYCEIADTAAQKRETAVHPLVLVAGYLAAWLVVSTGFAIFTFFIQYVARQSSGSVSNLLPASLALGVAGVYQFSGLKEACLKKCRRPFATLFARWSTKRGDIFRLGVQQGIWCVGCCWALMLVMFAVGLMNVFWMALIGLFTIVEKHLSGRVVSRVAGAILLVWSAALLVLSAASG